MTDPHAFGDVVVRMCPSPTGHLHIGTARTALFNYLFARRYGGTLIVRSEDTDKQRSDKAYETEILEGLSWLGIRWDAFYRQSERAALYTAYLRRAIENKAAYLSKEESRHEKNVTKEVVRLVNPNVTVTFNDLVRGEITFDTTELGDIIIARSIDDALYHFAVVVDDFEMKVTHVIRGDDHIANTARQILIQEAIGAPRPQYAHLPLILAPDRSKMSKRHGVVSISAYRKQGYLPEAFINYLAFLGWNPGTDQEIFTPEELARAFTLEGVQKSGAVFNSEKLRWINRMHLARHVPDKYQSYVEAWLPETLTALPQYNTTRLRRLLPVIQERVSVGADIASYAQEGEYDFAFSAPAPAASLLKWKHDDTAKDALPRLQRLAELLSQLGEDVSPEEVHEAIFPYAQQEGKGEVLWPLRVALSGRERSPDPFTIIHIIGAAEAYKRVQHACDTILRA